MTDYYGLSTRTLANDYLRLEYLAEAGPRLVRLILKNSASQDNLFAETPQTSWPTPYGEYCLHGGHRLWHAPESPPRSSMPDQSGLEVKELSDGVRLCQPTEPATGIRKSMEIRLFPDRPALTVKHELYNDGCWPVELAPWAITQLALGGVAVLPQTVGPLDPHGVLPNRYLVLWPYTQSRDVRLEQYNDFVLVHGRPQEPACKIGYLNRLGWAGYLLGDVFFVKRICPQPARPHPDFGCNVEVYCSTECLELETVAPLAQLAPGETVTHIEQWEFFTGLKVSPTVDEIRNLANALAPQALLPICQEA